MHNIEHKADEIYHDILTRLSAEFITPIDQEDILRLVQIIDDVTDALDEVVLDCYMFHIDELPDEDQDHYQTMGGFVTALFGYIPKKGESVRWENFVFEIVRLDRYRIDKIICTVEDKKQDNDGEEKD